MTVLDHADLYPEDLPADLPERLRKVLAPIAEANDAKRLAFMECGHNPKKARGMCSRCYDRALYHSKKIGAALL